MDNDDGVLNHHPCPRSISKSNFELYGSKRTSSYGDFKLTPLEYLCCINFFTKTTAFQLVFASDKSKLV